MRIAIVTTIVAVLFAGCSGAPASLPAATNTAPLPDVRSASSQIRNDAAPATFSLIGPVTSVVDGMFTMNAGRGYGYVHVYTAGATYSGVYLKPGTYARVTGTGSASTSVYAKAISVTTGASWTLAGPVTSVVDGMFTMNAGTGYGYVHVYTANAEFSGLYLKAGTYVRVTGAGSASTWIAASSIVVTKNAASVSMPHVLTADYLGGANGTHAISWAQAAPHLSWAETGVSDAPAISAAGIKTLLYVDPNREQTGSQLDTPNQSAYAHDCNGSRVHDLYAGVTQYVTEPSSTAMQSVLATYTAGIAAQAHFDALFLDDSGALSAFAPYTPFSAMPCGYGDSAWITAEIALDNASHIPVLINGLNALNGHQPSLGIGILAGGNAVGGTFEQCYDSQTQPKMDGWLWSTIEDSELQVAARGKLFECLGTNLGAATSEYDSRIYAYASFLMTYNPSTSIYRSEYGTGSGLHVFPETGLVALEPAIASPATVADLGQPGGTYARQYGACYLSGSPVGPCAVVVNPDQSSAHRFPFTQYHHTLALSGSGVLDGGTVSVAGAAPPSSLPADEAAIVFP